MNVVRSVLLSLLAVLSALGAYACGTSQTSSPAALGGQSTAGGQSTTGGQSVSQRGGASGAGGAGSGASGASGAGDATSTTEGGAASNTPNGAAEGDPKTGRWLDLGQPSAPEHAPAVAANTGEVTLGGSLTFTHIGAPGYWGRRIEAEPGDPRCDVQAEQINYSWGGSDFCCRTRHVVTSNQLTPFNEQITMVLDGPLRVKQLAVYQPLASANGPWALRSYWDRRSPTQPYNFHFSGPNKATSFEGDLGNNCSFFAMQERKFPCGPGSDPYCPGSDLDYYGWQGSKLYVLLASMPYADDPALKPLSCIRANEDERAQDSPWIGVAPSELNRDGWSGYNPCHCFANTNGAVGDGCGQINVFEVIAEASGAKWGNRDIISTGIRSYQVGSLGGVTCGIEGCGIEHFPKNADLLDANNLSALAHGAVIDADNRQMAAGPVWRRAQDDRYYLFLLDEQSRVVQVMVLHPQALPSPVRSLLPELPNQLPRSLIDVLVELRVPQ